MKKILYVISILIICICFVGCGNDEVSRTSELSQAEQDWIEEEICYMLDEDYEGFSRDAIVYILVTEYGLTEEQAGEAVYKVTGEK